MILVAYEHDSIPLDVAAQHLADVWGSQAGWTVFAGDSTVADSGPIGVKGRQAVDAGLRELRRRRSVGKH